MVGDCCIDSTERLTEQHEQMLRALEDGAKVELDLAGISRIDTAGLQLVLTFVLEMKRQGRDVAIAAVSEAVKQSAKSSGVTELLGF